MLKIKMAAMCLLAAAAMMGCVGNSDDDKKSDNKVTTPGAITTDPAVNVYPNLHVASPEWQDQVIYFVFTDRFNDGDTKNNDQGAGEYDPNNGDKYSGGDLQGIIDKVDYIKGLGATAVWITPPVANQWWDPVVQVSGYHGYWARNLKKVDEHYGTLDTYKKLSSTLHQKGMYLIQDVVPNHMGNFMYYKDDKAYNPANPGDGFTINTASKPGLAPEQAPFNMNDYNNTVHRTADIYHWTPNISDYTDPKQEKTYQMSNLDDLNTANPVVRKALKESYEYWIKEVGVDGFRVDTVKFVEFDFWNDFFHSADGVINAAKETGRTDFLSFGEVWETSDPLKDNAEKILSSYLSTDGKPGLPSLLNFPLHFTLRQVFAEGKPTNQLSYRMNATMDSKYYKNPYVMPVFIDNHDMARFLEKGSYEAMKQALTFMMTIPGIPIVYYGTEQESKGQRAALFAKGYQSGGKDGFDTTTKTYAFIKKLTDIRKSNKVFTRGTLKVLQDNPMGPGLLAYKREYEGKTALVMFNTADKDILAGNLDTGLPEGSELDVLNASFDITKVVVGKGGKLTMELPAKAGLVLMASGKTVTIAADSYKVNVSTSFAEKFTKDITVKGTVAGGIKSLKAIIDGNLSKATTVTVNADNSWQLNIPVINFGLGESAHTLVLYAPGEKFVSETFNINVNVTAGGKVISKDDPVGDDKGPAAKYTLPKDKSFTSQMDIVKTEVSATGTNLSIKFTMNDLTDVWKPTNGFDHVLFKVFIDLGNGKGTDILPNLNAKAPNGMKWNYMVFADGWNNAYYSSEGATATEYGKSITPGAQIKVDKSARTIEFVLTGDSLGNPETLKGAKIYATTWDFDGAAGKLRPLEIDGGDWKFGGGDGTKDPMIADSIEVITVDDSGAADNSVKDPAGDDKGPTGKYALPKDKSFTTQMDILAVNPVAAGGNLDIELTMADLTDVWKPTNGFDHVLFNVFIDLGNGKGTDILPNLNTKAPEGMKWNYLAFVDGWNNAYYSSEGATATEYGKSITPGPQVIVDKANKKIKFKFTSDSFGGVESLSGAKIYITTWDFDGAAGKLRPLETDGGDWKFGGGDGTKDPMIADDTKVIVVK